MTMFSGTTPMLNCVMVGCQMMTVPLRKMAGISDVSLRLVPGGQATEPDVSSSNRQGGHFATDREDVAGGASQLESGAVSIGAAQSEGSVVDDSDWPVVQSCLAGDADAFAVLVQRYQTLIQRQMRWYARDAGACEELTHDVFVQAYLSLSTYSAKAPFRHWLRKIASHVGYRHIKNMERQGHFFQVEEWDAVEPEAQETMDPMRAKNLLYGLLGRLGPEDRMALTLMYFEELGTKEIADRMGWNRAMVKMRVYRAKKKLRQIVEDEGLAEKYEF